MATLKQIRDKAISYLLDEVPETNALIDDFINDAVRIAEEMHNFRQMRRIVELWTTEGSCSLGPLPDRWKQMSDDPWLLADDGKTREIAWAPSWSEMIRRFNKDPEMDTGSPEFILEDSGSLFVYPFPDGMSDHVDGEYAIRVPYWGYSEPLVADNDTNYMTENADLYLLYYAVTEGFLKNQDERQAGIYQGRANQRLRAFINLDKRSRLPRRMNLRPRRDVFGPGKGSRGRL